MSGWEVCVGYMQKLHSGIERSFQILASVPGMSWNLFPMGHRSGYVISICSGVEKTGKAWGEAPSSR